MTKNQKRVFISTFVAASLLSIVYLIQSAKRDTRTPSFPSPSSQIPLQVIKSYPGSGEFTEQFSLSALIYTFNQSVTLDKIAVEIYPQIEFQISQSADQLTLYIHPLEPWKYKVKYSVKVIGVGGITLSSNEITFLDPSGVNLFGEGNPEDI